MRPQLKKIIVLLSGVALFGLFAPVYAATISVAPVTSEIGVGEKISVELKVDSEGTSFNATQVTMRFPKDLLEVIALDKTGSTFSFWLEEPQFSNTDGSISFTGGTPYGVSGSTVLLLKIEFRAKGTGTGTLSFIEAAINASDGSGTNILSKMNDAVLSVIPQRVTPKLPATGEKLPEPVLVVRKAVPTGKLPSKPVLQVPLYPEESRWYNLVSQFSSRWDLPLDVSGIATAQNTQPNYIPPGKSEGLFESKTYPVLSDGVRYLHLRFQNNIGWGPTAHYKIAVDTQPPLPFEASILEGEKTDNPTPTLQFETRDALSDLKEYQVRVGSGDLIHILASNFSGSFKLPLQSPGKKNLIVRAIDQAENSIEQSFDLEILPIAAPSITFVPAELFSEDEQGLTVRGTALSGINVLIKVERILMNGEEVAAEGVARSDDKGNWEFAFAHQPLRNGQYVVRAQSQDARGALSLPVESGTIRVKSKPIIQIGAFQLGMGGAISFLLLVLIAGFGGGVWLNKKRKQKLTLRVGFAESETTKIFKLISEDVDRMSESLKTPTTDDDAYTLKRLQENIKKMESYLKKGIEKIKR